MASALMQFGPLQFRIQPFNIHEVDHATSSDWAKKEIAGAAVHREWVGEGDEEMYLRGIVAPYAIGGLDYLDALEAMRKAGHADTLVRGDGKVLGWFVIEKLLRGHKFLSIQGIGKVINFEALFVRVPVPDGTGYFPALQDFTTST